MSSFLSKRNGIFYLVLTDPMRAVLMVIILAMSRGDSQTGPHFPNLDHFPVAEERT